MNIKKILVINGPNLNMLGNREPDIYGSTTLKEIEKRLSILAKELKIEVEFFQSNHEGAIIDKIQNSANNIFGIIINPAAFTHTSIAIRDALAANPVPTIEVHISNIYTREKFRHKSYIAEVTMGQITGLGIEGYLFAMKKLKSLKIQKFQK
ncbi:MAG: type II 3-dehydroquinate dehydratase [Endomicrobium sp.]|jgi:3-dehydroquinate dehydratase-2|nr:type II 3-dehydroquinate dehydratase [Endomicrobium sp.]